MPTLRCGWWQGALVFVLGACGSTELPPVPAEGGGTAAGATPSAPSGFDPGPIGRARGPNHDTASPCTPVVGEQLPAPNERDVPTATPIRVTIACREAPAERAGWSIRLEQQGHAVAGAAQARTEASTTATSFVPTRRLGLGTTYTTVVTDPAGSDVLSWSFSTRDGQWRASEIVGVGTTVALAVNPAGQGIVAFGQDPGDHLSISAARFDLDTGFSQTVDAVRTVDSTNLHDLNAGFDASGGALIAWVEYRLVDNGSNYTVWQSRSPAEGSWLTGAPVDHPRSAQWIRHASLRPDGTGLVLWEQSAAGTAQLRAQSLLPGGEDAPVTLEDGSGNDTVAALMRDGGGWVLRRDYQSGLFAQRQTRSGDWTDVAQLSSQRELSTPSISVSADGTAFASYAGVVRDAQSANSDGFVQRLGPTGWSAPSSLDTRGSVGSTDTLGLTTAMDPYGNAVAVWTTRSTFPVSQTPTSTTYGSLDEIRVQRFDSASGWARAHLALDSDPPSAPFTFHIPAAVALDAQGNGIALWSRETTVRVNRFRVDSGWEGARTVDVSSGAPNLAVDD